MSPLPSLRRRPIAVAMVLAVLWSLASFTGLFARAEWVGYHALFEARGPQPRPEEILILGIDEASMEGFETWPIPRSLYGHLIDGLVEAGAAVVGVDVTFPQAQFPQNDEALAAVLRRHGDKVVLAANFQPLDNGLHQGEQLVLPYAPFRQAAAVGIVNLDFDADGGIHRFRPERTGVDPENLSAFKRYEGFDRAIARRFAPDRLPEWAHGEADHLINFVGPPGRVRHLSMIQALEAVYARDAEFLSQFRGRIVLVGATALRLQDQYATPYSALALGGGAVTYMPGVEIHANVIATLLRNNPIAPTPAPLRGVHLLAVALAFGAAFAMLKPRWGLLALLGGIAAVWGASIGLFATARVWLDPVVPTGLLVTLYVAAVVEAFLHAERMRRYVRQTFERYVAPDIVSEILRNPGMAPKMGGEKREISVLFSDIRSFTTISEQLTPEEVVEFLNAYLSAMAEVILAQKGCIDKYIGDAILALWGNVKRLSPEESATLAVRTALAMKAEVEARRAEWQAKGYPHIEIGVGVNTGEAVVGNLGSPQKLEFGVIGDSINVASRLEGLTKHYDGAVVISDRTRELIGDRFACTYLDTVKVKGREQPVAIYRVDGEIKAVASA